MNPEMQQNQKAADVARATARLLTRVAAALIALGVLIMFIPSHGSHRLHQVSGILVIVGGLFLLGWTAYLRRRIR
jgi:uncharacterized membrane protein HdeD (DUF308 family)